MKKRKNKSRIPADLLYFNSYEETVKRKDDTAEKEFCKALKFKRIKTRLRKTVCFISAFALLLSGSFLAKRGVDKYRVHQQEKTSDEYVIPDTVTKKLDSMTESEAWGYLYEKYPELMNIQFPAGMTYDFALYYKENPQTVGYIKVDGTIIDTPVVQADNNKYYLTHDFYNKSTSYGAIFASHIDSMRELDRNTLLYGHNMRDGSRFAALTQYKSMDFFKKYPTIEFNTLFEKHKWKIYAVIETNGDVDGDDGYFFDFTFNNCSDACFSEYIKELDKRKLYNTGVDLLPTDKLLTLCTCTYEFTNARLIVVARMVRDGESENVDTTLASYKSSVKYPAIYYKNPDNNPYKDEPKWYLY